MAKILVHLTHGPEQPKQAEMAFSVAKKAIDGGHTVTVLLAEDFFPLVHNGAANITSDVCQRNLREYYSVLVRQGAKFEVSGPPVQPATKPKGKQFKALPGFAVPEALLRLSVGQDRIFTY
jgi:predicted peroxiredoxin